MRTVINYFPHSNNVVEEVYQVDEAGNAQGVCEKYSITGELRSRYNYKDGELDGPFEVHHSNGSSEKGSYKNGKKDGVFEWRDHSGLLRKECSYKDDQLDGPYEEYHFLTHNCTKSCNYKNGRLHGPYATYEGYRGVKKVKCNYKDGRLDGVFERYWSDDVIRTRKIFKDGKEVVSNPKKSVFMHIEFPKARPADANVDEQQAQRDRREVNEQLGKVHAVLKRSTLRKEAKKELVKSFREKYPQKGAGRAPRKPRGGNEGM